METWGKGRRGGNGGGVVDVEAGELVLNGEIRARGESRTDSGAGGARRQRAGAHRHAARRGPIDASGGDHFSRWQGRRGGGGRVAIYAAQVDGFDARLQAKVRAARAAPTAVRCSAYGAPGTMLVWQTGLTDGRLIVDSGEASGVDRLGVPTRLPSLGTGAVISLTADAASAADAWVARRRSLGVQWTRAWMVLTDATGTELGAFRVAELDGSGRARLEGAAAVTGAAVTGMTWRGEYRFDAVELRHGAGLDAADPVVVTAVTSTATRRRAPRSVPRR